MLNEGTFEITTQELNMDELSTMEAATGYSDNYYFDSNSRIVKEELSGENKSHRFWLLDNTGGIISKIDLNASFIKVSSKYILSILENKEEERIVYCTPRSGSIKTDLLKIQKIEI